MRQLFSQSSASTVISLRNIECQIQYCLNAVDSSPNICPGVVAYQTLLIEFGENFENTFIFMESVNKI